MSEFNTNKKTSAMYDDARINALPLAYQRLVMRVLKHNIDSEEHNATAAKLAKEFMHGREDS